MDCCMSHSVFYVSSASPPEFPASPQPAEGGDKVNTCVKLFVV